VRRARRATALVVIVVSLAVVTRSSGVALARESLQGPVVHVVDGDTIRVRLGTRVEKVRYIGIDTPEVRHPSRGEEPGGREASAINRTLVSGRTVRLEMDVQTRDRHGRLLAYVWVGDTMVNAELVRLGYAQVMTVPPNVRHQALFLDLQRQARARGRGLWRPPEAAASRVRPAALREAPPVSAKDVIIWMRPPNAHRTRAPSTVCDCRGSGAGL
jgi:endonuclease YncB( thermonuclease family)